MSRDPATGSWPRDPDDGSGIGDVLFVLAIAVLGGGVLYLLWSHHHDHHTVAD